MLTNRIGFCSSCGCMFLAGNIQPSRHIARRKRSSAAKEATEVAPPNECPIITAWFRLSELAKTFGFRSDGSQLRNSRPALRHSRKSRALLASLARKLNCWCLNSKWFFIVFAARYAIFSTAFLLTSGA